MRVNAATALGLAVAVSTAASAASVLEVQPGTPRPGDALLITVSGATPLRGGLGSRPLKFFRWKDSWRALIAVPVSQPLGPLELWIDAKAGPPPRILDAGALDGGSASADAGSDGGEEDEELAESKPTEEPDSGTDAGRGASDAGQPHKPAWALAGLTKEPALTATLEVVDPHFPARELTLASKYIHPPKAALTKIAEDSKAIGAAYRQGFHQPLFTQNFVWPREAEITSHFGDLRTLNGVKQSQHMGTDLEGRIGDPILAANDGVVVLARECYASGNTVLVHHGIGLFTAYFHMSHIDVKVGQHVKSGQKLGLVGKTGQVTGPHLHFGVKVQGNYVNPESLEALEFTTSEAN